MQRKARIGFLVSAICCLCAHRGSAIEVVVDYTYDTSGFFDAPIRRTALEAVANRYSEIITSELLPVGPVLDLGQPTAWRIGFSHPGLGDLYQLSTAANRSSDVLYSLSNDPADEYGFPGLVADQWILFAGARDLNSAGIGGTATGRNFTPVFDAIDGPLHRGTIQNTPSNSINDLPAWGGAISFNQNQDWHFELDEPVGDGEVDFYSIALHEVGHALGLSNSWNQWQSNVTGTQYRGENAVAAYNADHGTSLSYLSTHDTADAHWLDGTYQSYIFPLGNPNLVGTVGDGLQDLLLEPIANFTSSTRRFEVTNVDAASLVDVGWSILEEPRNPLDQNDDGEVGLLDIDLACAMGNDLEPYFAELQTLRADLDLNGNVGFSDFLILSGNYGNLAAHSQGDVTCDGSVGFDDFLILSGTFGDYAVRAHAVPEPHSTWTVASVVLLLFRRSSRHNNPSARA